MAKRDCVHHWRVESPTGARTVRAKCKRCGRVREYPAAAKVQSWSEQSDLFVNQELKEGV